mmetsp:Transcript_15193/g.24190  ORF Transcript_15193/g.24190 Transcript_15193/m.24190 type:complete len:237 (+) Transcript_15193:308-1018(+)
MIPAVIVPAIVTVIAPAVGTVIPAVPAVVAVISSPATSASAAASIFAITILLTAPVTPAISVCTTLGALPTRVFTSLRSAAASRVFTSLRAAATTRIFRSLKAAATIKGITSLRAVTTIGIFGYFRLAVSRSLLLFHGHLSFHRWAWRHSRFSLRDVRCCLRDVLLRSCLGGSLCDACLCRGILCLHLHGCGLRHGLKLCTGAFSCQSCCSIGFCETRNLNTLRLHGWNLCTFGSH